MKLLDKIKDLFMDEVIEDDEIEIGDDDGEEKVKEFPKPPKKEEPVLPKVMREAIKEEEPKPKVEEKKKSFVSPDEFMNELRRQEPKEEPKIETQPKKFAFPIEFEDVPTRNVKPREEVITRHNVNVLDLERENAKKVSELYPKKEEVKEKPKFKATPVISPVYGILDKNYKKDEVKERDEENNLMKRPSKKVDFETVRKKAFGNLADDIKDNLLCENCELYKEVKKISALSEDDLLYDMTVDDDEKDVTIAKAYDNYEEFGVAYEPKPERKITVDNDIHIEETTYNQQPEEKKEEMVKEDRTNLDDIINNSQKIDEAVINDHDEDEEVRVLDKPIMTYQDKVDETIQEEEMPKRSEKKKEAKVDDDFFELIDSMYKERTDD